MPQRVPQRTGQAWPKAYRLRARAEYLAVQRRGKRVTTKDLVVLFRAGPKGLPRLGITVSRKVSKRAVDRNRIKRWVKELWRRLPLEEGPVLDVVIIARKSALRATQASLQAQLTDSWESLR